LKIGAVSGAETRSFGSATLGLSTSLTREILPFPFVICLWILFEPEFSTFISLHVMIPIIVYFFMLANSKKFVCFFVKGKTSHSQTLKISFSQPNLRKAGLLNLKFPATGYEAAQQEKFLIYSKVCRSSLICCCDVPLRYIKQAAG
jgi:hypothetical protein